MCKPKEKAGIIFTFEKKIAHVCLFTQRSGAEEDSPGRLPPSSSSSVFYLLSSLHGSQLLTRFVMIHQPDEHTQTHIRGVEERHTLKLMQFRDEN